MPGQLPDDAIVFVTVYVPAELAARFICPVDGLIFRPADELKTPALAAPLKTGKGNPLFDKRDFPNN